MGAIFTPSVYHTELIDGHEVEKPLPKDLHAFIQSFLLVRLAQQLSRRYRVLAELKRALWIGSHHSGYYSPASLRPVQ